MFHLIFLIGETSLNRITTGFAEVSPNVSPNFQGETFFVAFVQFAFAELFELDTFYKVANLQRKVAKTLDIRSAVW